jgi:hypothetical protein
MTMLDHHDLSVMMAPAFVPAEVAMLANLGAGAVPVMVGAAFDYDIFSTCDRRRCDGNGAERCKNVSELLHVVLLQ